MGDREALEKAKQLAEAMKGNTEDNWTVEGSDNPLLWESKGPHSWVVFPLPPLRSICIDGVWYEWPLKDSETKSPQSPESLGSKNVEAASVDTQPSTKLTWMRRLTRWLVALLRRFSIHRS